MPANRRNVVHNPKGGWDVKGGGSRSSGHFDTQKQAIDKAKKIIDQLGGGEVQSTGVTGRSATRTPVPVAAADHGGACSRAPICRPSARGKPPRTSPDAFRPAVGAGSHCRHLWLALAFVSLATAVLMLAAGARVGWD
jgi:hypothetical protein